MFETLFLFDRLCHEMCCLPLVTCVISLQLRAVQLETEKTVKTEIHFIFKHV